MKSKALCLLSSRHSKVLRSSLGPISVFFKKYIKNLSSMMLLMFLLLPLLTVHSTWGDTQPAACCPPSVYEVKATMFQAIQEDSRFKYQEVRFMYEVK